MDKTTSDVHIKVTWTVLAILATAFMAWAGVVWHRSGELLENQNEILVNQARDQQMMNQLMRGFDKHERLPWHSEAGQQIIELRGLTNSHERRIVNLEDGRHAVGDIE